MNRSQILNHANQCVTVDRQATHGNAEDSFSAIADLWCAYMRHKGYSIVLGPDDVANMMALMKIGRIIGNPRHADSYVDACGYLSIAGEIAGE